MNNWTIALLCSWYNLNSIGFTHSSENGNTSTFNTYLYTRQLLRLTWIPLHACGPPLLFSRKYSHKLALCNFSQGALNRHTFREMIWMLHCLPCKLEFLTELTPLLDLLRTHSTIAAFQIPEVKPCIKRVSLGCDLQCFMFFTRLLYWID